MLEKSEKVLFDSKVWTFRSSCFGMSFSDSIPSINQEKLWDKIKELVGEGKYLNHIVDQKQITLKEIKTIDEKARLFCTDEMATVTETQYRTNWYVIVYYEN